MDGTYHSGNGQLHPPPQGVRGRNVIKYVIWLRVGGTCRSGTRPTHTPPPQGVRGSKNDSTRANAGVNSANVTQKEKSASAFRWVVASGVTTANKNLTPLLDDSNTEPNWGVAARKAKTPKAIRTPPLGVMHRTQNNFRKTSPLPVQF